MNFVGGRYAKNNNHDIKSEFHSERNQRVKAVSERLEQEM